jgi:S-adenosylmethionine:tRNA ribosyltransferase-isomerase
MTRTLDQPPAVEPARVAFALDPAHEAHEPPEARGLRRDEVRLLVSRGTEAPVDARFTDLPAFLDAGDLLVVNTSATIPAALDGRLPAGDPIVVHLSGPLPGDLSLVEARRPDAGTTAPLTLDHAVDIALLGGGRVRLVAPFADSRRLWVARFEADEDPVGYATRHGRPIRYRHVPGRWPIEDYQTVFAQEPGSAEMPSAARPFSARVVTDLVRRGVQVAPILLHTGVSSLEGGARPHPEPNRVTAATAAHVEHTHRLGGRVVAAGTTVVRALATVTDDRGRVHPGSGWTEAFVTPAAPATAVDALLTGWHEPESSHLLMLESVAAPGALGGAYRAALDLGYLWHEFGDSHLILRGGDGP